MAGAAKHANKVGTCDMSDLHDRLNDVRSVYLQVRYDGDLPEDLSPMTTFSSAAAPRRGKEMLAAAVLLAMAASLATVLLISIQRKESQPEVHTATAKRLMVEHNQPLPHGTADEKHHTPEDS